MKIYSNPSQWDALLERPTIETANLENSVQKILDAIKLEGDKAVKYYAEQFDKVNLQTLEVTQEEINAALVEVPENLKKAIQQAKNNIETFHKTQQFREEEVETTAGITCWRKSVAIDKVGLYIPAGTAPLFSTVLMLGIPAKIAGCKEIILCSPSDENGQINPVILYTAQLVGCTKIFKIGGVQAIGAMAYGTETIPQVYKIFGPGNQYVTCAKQLVSRERVAIDMPAGPSELLVFADADANPAFVAADLLSQAEHGVDSQVILVTTELAIAEKVNEAIERQLANLPRKAIAKGALANSRAIVFDTDYVCVEFINAYAPEHLIINTKNAEEQALNITNAGSVFLGAYTPESLGDYASGTNHTLPTNGFARSYSGVSVDSFVKKITFQKATAQGLNNIGWAVEAMAAAEQLEAHKQAVTLRLEALKDPTTNSSFTALKS